MKIMKNITFDQWTEHLNSCPKCGYRLEQYVDMGKKYWKKALYCANPKCRDIIGHQKILELMKDSEVNNG